MPSPSFGFQILDPRPILKYSRLRYGRFEARGVPAILFGVAAIVVATGVAAGVRRAASLIPETLREARDFWRVARAPRPELAS
jgi:hypothetical protein